MAIETSVVILTYNSQDTIGATLSAAERISSDIHVVDSFSKDNTETIVRQTAAKFYQHEFLNYAAQRNWAIETLPLLGQWELHLDADERPSEALIDALLAFPEQGDPRANGYLIPRLTVFLGRALRHGGLYPVWHCRLFRRGRGRCEERQYDQHFFVDGPVMKLPHPIIDDVRMPLAEWSSRHVRWSQAEVLELRGGTDGPGQIKANRGGNAIEQKRHLKQRYYSLPLFYRALAFFLYRYILLGGFMDGREGFIYYVLQTFWFRFLVDAQIYESKKVTRGDKASGP